MILKRYWLTQCLLLCLASPLVAQGDIASMVPRMQAALRNVSCPASASAASCASFHKMVESGSLELTAQFAAMFMDPKTNLYLIYVVFENSADSFWVISTDYVRKNSNLAGLHLASYGQYQEGKMVTGALAGDEIIPPGDNGVTTWSSSKDGVTVSYYSNGNTSVTTQESWQGSDGGTRTVKISVDKTDPADAPQAPETLTFTSPTQSLVRNGTALKFTTPVGNR